ATAGAGGAGAQGRPPASGPPSSLLVAPRRAGTRRRVLAVRRGVEEATLGPEAVDAPLEPQQRVRTEMAVEDLAVATDLAHDLRVHVRREPEPRVEDVGGLFLGQGLESQEATDVGVF